MLDKEDEPEFDDEWLNSDERLTCFNKHRERIVGSIKGSESPSVQGPHSSEEDLVLSERVSRRTERLSVREPGTDINHAPIDQSQNDGSSANIQ